LGKRESVIGPERRREKKRNRARQVRDQVFREARLIETETSRGNMIASCRIEALGHSANSAANASPLGQSPTARRRVVVIIDETVSTEVVPDKILRLQQFMRSLHFSAVAAGALEAY